ncbi:hypothetical protein HRI_004491900 [Hibiscus trionum]|uniref:Uncharacterized protein n=1 Tax=Hibiscus trionum TaxID=183268 RepID=A0A9W7J552_HIBTR|nr:hypothetical protein HRI_004491900 [Hibiscus trionum]
MIVICWNCRWLETPTTVRALGKYITSKNPHIVFVCEARLDKRRVDSFRRRHGMAGCLTVEERSCSRVYF